MRERRNSLATDFVLSALLTISAILQPSSREVRFHGGRRERGPVQNVKESDI
jgi:hypothetical protein